MAPNISIRESIRWIPDPFSEPTSTLVLTSAAKRFVDIRVLKDSSLSQHSPSMTEDTGNKFYAPASIPYKKNIKEKIKWT